MENKIVVRDSNMELYRIIAMLCVILFHMFGEVDLIGNSLFPDTLKPVYAVNMLFTSVTFVCVDMFILLSGWYGINTRWNKIKAFLFQVLFYSAVIYGIMLLCCPSVQFSWNFLIHIFLLDNYWFIPVYLMLYLFAPAINPFIKKSSDKEFLALLLAVFFMQTVYGWLNLREEGYMSGCSPISFLILYLIGAYMRRIAPKTSHISKKTLCFAYIGFITIHWIIALLAKYLQSDTLTDVVWQFSSPLIILASACLLLFFSKVSISYNKTINWIAASCFAVFLIHCFPPFYKHVFSYIVRQIAVSFTYPVALPLLLLFVLVLYAACILTDQVRIYIYRKISSAPASSR